MTGDPPRDCPQLAERLTIDANNIIADIDRNLRGKCKFGRQLFVKFNELKMQNGKLTFALLAACKKDKQQRKLVKIELDNLNARIRDLDQVVVSQQKKQPDDCQRNLHQIHDSLGRLSGCFGNVGYNGK